jgi:DNA-binding response OmpR family regulator
MLTAKGEEQDRVKGLNVGADDYVVKPFSATELVARVRAVLRRTQEESAKPEEEVLSGPGGLRLDAAQRTVTVGAAALALTKLEFDLLYTLLVNAGRVLTRERLLEQVWGYDFAGDARAVDSAVKRLRAELRAASPESDAIEAVRGLGYKYHREGA